MKEEKDVCFSTIINNKYYKCLIENLQTLFRMVGWEFANTFCFFFRYLKVKRKYTMNESCSFRARQVVSLSRDHDVISPRKPPPVIGDQWSVATGQEHLPKLGFADLSATGIDGSLVPFTCYSPASSSIMLFYEYYIGFTWSQRCVCVLLGRAVRSTHKITDISIFSPSTSAREKCMHR